MVVRGIVVGVDGSSTSGEALRWAAAEAARRDTPLTVINAYDWRVLGAPTMVGGEYATTVLSYAEDLVSAAVVEARAIGASTAATDTPVRGEAILSAPGSALVAASAEAELVVVGHRGRGGFASLVLGSVSQQVATHAHGPVVVVRGRPDPVGPVIVGVDGSDESGHALAIAFETARVRGCDLVAIRAFTPAVPPWGPSVPPYVEDTDARRAAERKILTEDVAPWQEKFPDVSAECVIAEGHPAEVLAGVSGNAQLVVVGTRGHGGFAGLMLGSVGLQVLHHADCPVLIARPHQPAK